MSLGQPSVGVIGFEIFIATGLDLTSASGITLAYRKPSGDVGTFTATAAVKDAPRGNTTYGAKYITTDEADLDEAGEWEFQVAVVMPGFTGAGQIATLEIIEAL